MANSGTTVGSEAVLNLIGGANVTVATVDNTANGRVDVTLSAAGTAGGVQSWLPSSHGFLAWTNDVAECTTTVQPTTQQVLLTKFYNPITQTANNISVYVNTAGSGLTAAYFGIYDMTGTLVGSTGEVSSTLAATGAKTSALSSSVSLTAATYYWVGTLVVGTTIPQFIAPPSLGSGQINFGLTAATALVASVAGTTSTLPSSFTPSGSSLSSRRMWAGIS